MTLDTDAYGVRVWFVHLQQQLDETTEPIRYLSKSLTNAEHKYEKTRRDWLAIARSLLFLWKHLKETRFPTRTDYDSPKRILKFTDSTRQLASWCLRLSEFEFEVVHWGKKTPSRRCALPPLCIESKYNTIGRWVTFPRNRCARRKTAAAYAPFVTNSDDVISLGAQLNSSLNTTPTEEAFVIKQAVDN